VRIGSVRIFDGERVHEDRDVVVDNDVIADISPAVSAVPDVDGRGHTLLPGLFDAHVHVDPQPDAALRQLLEMGVTTALDMFSGGEPLASMVRLRGADSPQLAAVRTAGTGATAPGSMLQKLVHKLTGQTMPAVEGPTAAEWWVDARLSEGADYVKIIYDEREGGPLDLATMTALVRAAHARGVLAVAHVMGEPQAREAICAGVDGLMHLFVGEAVEADFGSFAADHGIFVVPTLIALRAVCGHRPIEDMRADPRLADPARLDEPPIPVRPADPSRHHLYGASTAALRQLLAAGVPLLAGTDTALPTATLGVVGYGATLHAELELLVEAGLSPTQALVAATSAPARAFRLTDRGLVRPGLRADLLLVRGDPTTEIRDTRNIVAVWKRGTRLEPVTPTG
jgi:imidazolonepropionase-like amidohydrolase